MIVSLSKLFFFFFFFFFSETFFVVRKNTLYEQENQKLNPYENLYLWLKKGSTILAFLAIFLIIN